MHPWRKIHNDDSNFQTVTLLRTHTVVNKGKNFGLSIATRGSDLAAQIKLHEFYDKF